MTLFESLRQIPPRRLILVCSLVASLSVTIGYFITALLPMNLFQMVIHLGQGRWDTVFLEVVKLGALLITLFVPFAAAGIALAIIFATRTENISRLYFADLSGAALGCTMIIPIMVYLSPPGGVLLAGFFFAISGWNLARDEGGRWPAGVIISAVLSLITF